MSTRKRLPGTVLYLFSLLLLFSQHVHAHTPTHGRDGYIFGPVQYHHHFGKPRTQISNFSSRVSGTGFVLRVHNGNHHGRHRVSSATIVLNGETIVGPSELNYH